MEYIRQETASELASSDRIQERSGHSTIHHWYVVHHEMLALPSSVTDLVHQRQHAPKLSTNSKPISKKRFIGWQKGIQPVKVLPQQLAKVYFWGPG